MSAVMFVYKRKTCCPLILINGVLKCSWRMRAERLEEWRAPKWVMTAISEKNIFTKLRLTFSNWTGNI